MSVSLIPVYRRKRPATFAIVDDGDLGRVGTARWYLMYSGYASRPATKDEIAAGHPSAVLIHRLIMGVSASGLGSAASVDHINGDKLDNRRCNLRVCTHAENCRNNRRKTKTGARGVVRVRGKWQAHIYLDYKQIYLGRFPTKSEALMARRKAEAEYHGQYATVERDPGGV